MKKSNKIDGRPSWQFYPSDWLGDDALRGCSLGARGLWIDLLCLMWTSPIRGVLLKANNKKHTIKSLSKRLGDTEQNIKEKLQELEEEAVLSKRDDDAIYSRRMFREWDIRRKRSEAGSTKKTIKTDNKSRSKVDQKGVSSSLTSSSSSPPSTTTKIKEEDFLSLVKKEDIKEEEVEEIFLQYIKSYLGERGTYYRSPERKIAVAKAIAFVRLISENPVKALVKAIRIYRTAYDWHYKRKMYDLVEYILTDEEKIEKLINEARKHDAELRRGRLS